MLPAINSSASFTVRPSSVVLFLSYSVFTLLIFTTENQLISALVYFRCTCDVSQMNTTRLTVFSCRQVPSDGAQCVVEEVLACDVQGQHDQPDEILVLLLLAAGLEPFPLGLEYFLGCGRFGVDGALDVRLVAGRFHSGKHPEAPAGEVVGQLQAEDVVKGRHEYCLSCKS